MFRHNCNNFSDAFSNFLVGKGIPDHIVDMPRAVIDSPLGQMLLPQLTQSVNANRANGSILGLQNGQNVVSNGKHHGVKVATSSADLSRFLDSARDSCAVVFFTSATCPPCKMMYPVFDELAEEHGDNVSLIKIDISQPTASQAAQMFGVSATPTFITMLKGQEENRWSGADQAALRCNVQLLIQMAHPTHPHAQLRLPTFGRPDIKPVTYAKVPPMAKLEAKMGSEVAEKPQVQSLKQFIEAKSRVDAVLPDLGQLSNLIVESIVQLPAEILFTVVDLFRCSLADVRVSGYFAEEEGHKAVRSVLDFVNGQDACPYALRLVTLQMACNLFSSPLFGHEVLRQASIRTPLVQLVSTSFLDDSHNNVRVAASSLLFNIALANRRARTQAAQATLPDEDQVEVAAALVEAIGQEDKSLEALQGMLSALGHLVYEANLDGELADLLRALDAQSTVTAKKKQFPNEKLIAEVGDELLGKGLKQ